MAAPGLLASYQPVDFRQLPAKVGIERLIWGVKRGKTPDQTYQERLPIPAPFLRPRESRTKKRGPRRATKRGDVRQTYLPGLAPDLTEQ